MKTGVRPMEQGFIANREIERHGLIVTGSQGRVGRLIQQLVNQAESEHFRMFSIFWTSRSGLMHCHQWDLLLKGEPNLPKGAFLLHLAAVLPRPGNLQDVSANVTLAQSIIDADQGARFRHVFFLSTVAVYGAQTGVLSEECQADPRSPYGHAKLMAEMRLAEAFGERLTILRLANLAGADSLLGGNPQQSEIILDPVEGSSGGPVRSYIGPITFVNVLAKLLALRASGERLPPILNIAQPGTVSMGALLEASKVRWRFGPLRFDITPSVEVDVSKLATLCDSEPATAASILAELDKLRGEWP